MTYIGRFAPSPTGPLHLGSLYTAVASYLDAKANQGQWFVRIEDLDPPREQPGATTDIIHTLEAHGLNSDFPIIMQSLRHELYQHILNHLIADGSCFVCECSRQVLMPFGEGYPGTCRKKQLTPDISKSIRLIAEPPAESFKDRLLGLQYAPTLDNGLSNDFVIKRKEGFFAYQLAVVIDDIEQGVTDVVRGSDILDSTFKQIYLYRALDKPLPNYLHLPVIQNSLGQKLSKQNLARAVNPSIACENLLLVLSLLQQTPPPPELSTSTEKILSWAISHWNTTTLPVHPAISYS